MRKPKILFIIRGPFGLMGTNASYMLPSWASKHADVTVLSPKPKKREVDKIVFSNPDVNVINIQNTSVRERAYECAVYIDKLEPDIVHVMSHPKCILYPLIFKFWKPKSKVKWYLDIRSHIFGLGKAAHFKERVLNSFTQLFFDSISATAKDSYNSYFLLPLRKFQWSPIGVELDKFKKVISPNENTRRRRFVFAGSIAKVRELNILIDGFGLALNSNSDITLEFYGAGNAVESLKKQVSENGWSENIIFHGIFPSAELFEELANFDAGFLYLPKEKFDYAPALKRLEYASAGIEIIESNTRWNVENVEEFSTYQFENTPCSIAETILNFCEVKDKISSVKENREKVGRFDWGFIFKNDVLPIYSKLIKFKFG